MQTIYTPWQLNNHDRQLIDLALSEDLGWPFHDVTTDLLLKMEGSALARVISKHPEPIVLCGLSLVRAIIEKLHNTINTSEFTYETACELLTSYQDGDVIMPQDELFRLQGSPMVLLMAERTILNFLQRLCAIATLTAKYVEKVKHTKAKILDTRKTLPGFRHLEKYAVKCGGGMNHRLGLYDAVMIKDTHIDVLGGIKHALAKLPMQTKQDIPVIVEVRNREELEILLSGGLQKVSRVLLDNMPLPLLKECVALCHGKIATEASGSVTLETVKDIAETGVDFISIGRLTHSATNVDLSMKCDLSHV